MLIQTRYGKIRVSYHAIERWKERTGRSEQQLKTAVETSHRPTKRQLRIIMKREQGFKPKRILECQHAYFIIKNHNIVTVYQKERQWI